MRIRTRDRRATVGSGLVTTASVAWNAIQFFNDAADLPKDASNFWRLLVTMDPLVPWAIFLLAACILAWSLWPRPNEPEAATAAPSTGPQTTHGPHSPNYAKVEGNVNNYYGPPNPAEKQERKMAHQLGPRLEDRSSRKTRESAEFHEGLRRYANFDAPQTLPDMRLNELLMRVYAKYGPAPQENPKKPTFWKKIDHAIADAVAINNLHVWGRIGSKPIARIELYRWEEGTFDHRAAKFVWVGPLSSVEYTDLCFNRHEMDRIFPKGTANGK